MKYSKMLSVKKLQPSTVKNVPSVINKLPQINVDSVHHADISVENLTDEQNPNVNNQEVENSRQNQSNSEPTANIINIKLKTPMNPTPLEYSYWSTHPTETAVCAFAVFTSIVMVVGVLTICFTTKITIPKCQMNFKRTAQNPVDYNYGPRFVAIGDFNNDTFVDIVVANQLANQIAVYNGYGNGYFTNPSPYATGQSSSPYMVAVGDFNSDHRSDIAVANYGTNAIGIFFGFENGSFANQLITSTGPSRPIWIYIDDFNNDTLADIVTANSGTDSISILFGYGNGSFSFPFLYSTGYDSLPISVVAGDFNNDKQLDLVVANSGTNNIGIFLGLGNGAFTNQTMFSSGSRSHPYSVAVDDFNDDSLLDIAIANYGSNSVGVLLGYGNGTFAIQTTYPIVTASPYSIAVGDLNKDNRLDIVVTNKGKDNIAILFGFGNGSFESPRKKRTGSSLSTSVAIADFNNDQRPDISVVNNDINSIDILLGYDAGYFINTTRYLKGSSPLSVTVGDFNNDSRLDIIVAQNVKDNVAVLLGYGNGSFANQMTYSTGYNPQSAAVGDFNNDFQLDIVVANCGGNTVSILLGYGNGSFANQITYPTGSIPQSAAVGDFNNNSQLDIVIANYNDGTISVLLGYGNGSFANQMTYLTGSGPRSVAVGDLNNDRRLDIIVANSGATNVSVFFGYGNGSFANQMTYSTGPYPRSVAVGDFNNDRRLDIVTANEAASSVGILLGYGNCSFASEMTFSTGVGSHPRSAAVGDFNKDTQLDVIVANNQNDHVGLLLGHSDGSLANPIMYPIGFQLNSVAVGDFNNDTRLDTVVTSNHQIDSGIHVLLYYDPVAFGNEVTLASGGGSRLQCVAVVDFNKDTQMDIAVANYGTKNVGILLGNGNGTFGIQTLFTIDSNSSSPYSIAVGDFNNDTQLDIAVASDVTNYTGMLLGNGKGTFVSQSGYGISTDTPPFVVAAGDFNNDRQSEIVVAYIDRDNIAILVPWDTGLFKDQMTYSTGSRPQSVAIGDFNNDIRLDIVVANSNDSTLGVLLGYGNGFFSSQMTYPTGSYPWSVAVGDFNSDARLDIVVAVYNSYDSDGNVEVLLGYGNGSFANPVATSTGSYSLSLAVGDFNNDSQLDIVVDNYNGGTVSVLLGYGNGSFVSQILCSTGYPSSPVAVGDFNNDFQLDIIVAIHNWNVSVLLGYGNGSFANQITHSTGYYLQSAAVGDFNNDNRLDIVVATANKNQFYSVNNVGVMLGYGNGSFAHQTTLSNCSYPWSVAVGDFNNDTRLDIVVTTSYVFSETSSISVLLGYGNGSFANEVIYPTDHGPVYAAIGDLNNDKRLDIVVTNSLANNVGVFLGYANLAFLNQRILITDNGSRPQAFAIADFNNDDQMDIGVANSGTKNVGIFLGYGNGSFANQTTYSAVSSPYSIAAGDFNNDTYMDLVVTNSDSDNIGVFLGYGNGSFSSQNIFPTGSGSQPYSVAVVDLNNDTFLDIVVTNHAVNNVGILLGYGNGTFADLIKFPMEYGSHPFFVVGGDFNNDRKVDLAIGNKGFDSLQIFLQTC